MAFNDPQQKEQQMKDILVATAAFALSATLGYALARTAKTIIENRQNA